MKSGEFVILIEIIVQHALIQFDSVGVALSLIHKQLTSPSREEEGEAPFFRRELAIIFVTGDYSEEIFAGAIIVPNWRSPTSVTFCSEIHYNRA